MVEELVNPYIAGAPVTEARMFFGREDVFQWIETSLSGRYADHILVIHGQRRVGKTSVLKQLGNRLPKRYIPVFFDLQGRTHTTLDRFLWWLAREIVRVLKQERGIEVPLPEKDAFSADLEYFENQFLSGLHSSMGGSTLLLTFDEFDNLEESEIKEILGRPLIDYLRRIMGSPDLNFIFSIGSSGRKLENMQASYTEFFKTALYKKISFLDEEQTHYLVTRPVEGVLQYDKPAVNRIYKITGGHPYFTQLTCHELFARCQRTDQRHIREPDVEAVLEDVVERGTVNLKFVWDEASDIEKWSLAALAAMDGKSDNRTLADFLHKQQVRFSESELTSGLLHLREKDVLTPENRFVIHLLKLWLEKNRPIEQVREELTEVNPIANRYIEIGLEFKNSRQYEKAIESFQQALAVSPANVQAQVSIALVYMDQKAYDKAVGEFEKALAVDDEDVAARSGLCEAHLALGDAAMQKGRLKEAGQSYQRVLAMNEEHTEARGRMAEINRQRAEKALADGRDEEAVNAFLDALKYTPEDEKLARRLEAVKAEKKAKIVAGQIARSEKEAAAKNWEAAVRTLEEASQLAPEDPDVKKRLEHSRGKLRENKLAVLKTKAQAALKAERFGEAQKTWQEYLSLEPSDREQAEAEVSKLNELVELEGAYNEAQQAFTDKQFDKAISLLKQVIVRDENFKDTSRLLTQAIELRRSTRPARLALPVGKLLKGLLVTLVIAGIGIGAYFAWNQWGANAAGLFSGGSKVEKVCFLMTGMDDTRSYWNNTIDQAIVDAAKSYKLESKTFLTSIVKEQHEAEMTRMIKTEKCDLILGNGTWLKDAFYQFAKEYPKVRFSLIDMTYEESYQPLPKNLIEQTFKTFDSGYMAGYLAAGLTETGKVGTFGAENGVVEKEYMKGFIKGVEDYNGRHNTQIQALGFNIENGSGLFAQGYQQADENLNAHTELAKTLIYAENTDVLFIVSTPMASEGVLELIHNARTSDGLDIKVIGTDVDWAALYSTPTGVPALDLYRITWADLCITSATKDFEKMVKAIISRAVEEPDNGEMIEGNGSNQGVGLSPFNESIFVIPKEVKTDFAEFQYASFGIQENPETVSAAPPTATVDPRTLNPTNEHRYLLIDQPSDWHDARNYCAIRGGYLATVQNAEENNFIYQIIQNNNIWLGATDEVEEGTWKWVSGEPWEYGNWESGEPSGNGPRGPEHYLTFGSSLLWNDIPADELLYFVCEWNSSDSLITPTIDPAILLTALDVIRNEAPVYQTSFDAWDFGDPQSDAKVENGKLIVTSENQQHAGVGLYNLISDKYAVQFDLRVLETSPEGHCIFETTNDADSNTSAWRAISAGFSADGSAWLAHYMHPDQYPDLASSNSKFDFSKTNTVILIFLGDQIAAFTDGNLAFTAMDPDGSTVHNHQALSANFTAQCEFDNYKIWDLSGADFSTIAPPTATAAASPNATLSPSWVAEFAEPILAAIKDRTPDFQDNFSTTIGTWQSGTIESGVLRDTDSHSITNSFFLNKPNFVFQVDVGQPSTCCTHVRANDNNSIYLSPQDWGLCWSFKSDCDWDFLTWGTNKIQVIVIVKGTQFAFYLDGAPRGYQDRSSLGSGQAGLMCSKETCEFDNVKFWNLDNVPNLP